MAPMRAAIASLALLLAVDAGSADAQGRRTLLDVPYLTQRGYLCGGAALAMVLRYWGDRSAVAQDFSALVDRSREGIPTGALERAVIARGWRARMLPATANTDNLADEVQAGRPPIVLLEVGPDQYHYVVIVAVTPADVVVHDPAARPFETMPSDRFLKAWTAAGSWAMVALPREPRDRAPATDVAVARVATSDARCATFVDRGVEEANGGDYEASERSLMSAVSLCPDEAAGWRELAGLRFVASRWRDARMLSERAVALQPGDVHAWRILGASRYLEGDLLGALDAWNRVGEPRIDIVSATGLERTRHPVLVNRLGLEPRMMLTRSDLVRAQRRADVVPSLAGVTVRYEPQDDGRVAVEAAAVEREFYPWGWMGAAQVGGRTLILRELEIAINSPTSRGERLDLEWGWKTERPRVAARLTAPVQGPIPGIASLEVLWSRRAFAVSDAAGQRVVREQRRQVSLGLGDWATDRIHWQVEVGAGRFERARFAALGGGVDTRWFGDRLAAQADATFWGGIAGAPSATSGTLAMQWRQYPADSPKGWSGEAGFSGATNRAPLALWPGADSGSSRSALLRAHPLHSSGVVTGEVFGRRLAFGSITYQRPVATLKYGVIAVAGFVDTARAWRGTDGRPSPVHVDIGAGVRLHQSLVGSVRLDFGYGLRDGAFTVSAGFVRPWPRR